VFDRTADIVEKCRRYHRQTVTAGDLAAEPVGIGGDPEGVVHIVSRSERTQTYFGIRSCGGTFSIRHLALLQWFILA
jgi:hypothetical protein